MATPQRQTSVKKRTDAPPPAPNRINYFLLFPILFITLAVYWPSLTNELTNWDDQEYITYNKGLADVSLHQHFVDQPEVMGHYHPLTMLTLAWDYSNAHNEVTNTIDPVPFHRTNLLLHVLNTLLVYLFIFRLSKSNAAAAFTAAVFGLHPLHVESVAWAAERKDVLYTFFYLAALLTWHAFAGGKNKIPAYAFTFVFFVLSLLSKAAAVTLPLLLLAIDYYKGREFSWRLLAEKIPFLVLSVWFGLMAIETQGKFEAMSGNETYTLGERLLFGCYGTMQYIFKFFAPVNLSCFYPMPAPGALDPMYYAAPFFVAILLYMLYRLRKNKTVVFGALFFFITVIMVLQIVSVGGAIMADRYTYLPYVGIAFVLGMGTDHVIRKKQQQKQLAAGIPVAFILLLTVLAYNRTQVWENSLVLWADAERKEKNSPKIYNNYGDAYNMAGQYGKAIDMLNRALALKSDYPDAYYNRGLSLFYLKRYAEAVADYTRAIEYHPQLGRAWYNRAGTYFTMGRYKEAQRDALKAKELGYPVEPEFLQAITGALRNQAGQP